MNVLSLFDGMSCGQIALEKAGIPVSKYHASEIDKYAIQVTQHNYPNTIQLGDVTQVRGEDLPKIDLLIGGSPCFIESTPIISKKVIKPIDSVEVGDLVLTHKNRYRRVMQVGSQYSELYRILSQSNTETLTTAEHPYYLRVRNRVWDNHRRTYKFSFSDPKWVAIKDIKKGDYVGTPILKTEKNPLNLTEEECFVIGLYIGDGHTRKDYRREEGRSRDRHWQLIISVGEHEVSKFEKEVNLKYSLMKHTKNVRRAIFSSKRLVKYVEENCGCGADNKMFSKNILDLPKALLEKVIDGYLFLDGSCRKNIYRATTISRQLVETLTLAVAKVYKTTTCVEFTKRPKKCLIEGRVVNQKDTWTISFRKDHPKGSRAWIIGDCIWNPVKLVEKTGYTSKVYNIEVEEDNSYIANNNIVHNCQGFSSAGKQLNFEDPRSKLFFEYVRLLKECEPKYFLLENVVMKKEWENIISEYLGVKPILINSSLVSAQNRRRLYWTNIPNVQQPEDQNIYWKDVQMDNAKDVYYVTDKMMAWVNKNPKRKNKFKIYEKTTKEKMQMLEASHHKGISNQRCFAIRDNDLIRYIHPVECERLQNVSDGYTQVVSNTQRYRMLGNGWTVNVVAHIFKNIGQEPIPFEEFKKPNTLF